MAWFALYTVWLTVVDEDEVVEAAVFCLVDVELDVVLDVVLGFVAFVEVVDVDDVLGFDAVEEVAGAGEAVGVDVDVVEDDAGAENNGFDSTIPLFNAFAKLAK